MFIKNRDFFSIVELKKVSFKLKKPISVVIIMSYDHHNIEQAIRNATVPISSNETEEAEALGHRGILLNRGQIQNWNGSRPINQYRLNNDPNPEIITKVSGQPIEYSQEIQVRYLQPPAPQPHGDIIIREAPVKFNYILCLYKLIFILIW